MRCDDGSFWVLLYNAMNHCQLATQWTFAGNPLPKKKNHAHQICCYTTLFWGSERVMTLFYGTEEITGTDLAQTQTHMAVLVGRVAL